MATTAHDLRKLLRMLSGRRVDPSAMIVDGRTLQSMPESGARAGYDGYKKKKGSKAHLAVDTLGNLLAVVVNAANEEEPQQIAELCSRVQEATNQQVEIAYADQGYTGEEPRDAAHEHGIELTVVRLPEAKKASFFCPAAGSSNAALHG